MYFIKAYKHIFAKSKHKFNAIAWKIHLLFQYQKANNYEAQKNTHTHNIKILSIMYARKMGGKGEEEKK